MEAQEISPEPEELKLNLGMWELAANVLVDHSNSIALLKNYIYQSTVAFGSDNINNEMAAQSLLISPLSELAEHYLPKSALEIFQTIVPFKLEDLVDLQPVGYSIDTEGNIKLDVQTLSPQLSYPALMEKIRLLEPRDKKQLLNFLTLHHLFIQKIFEQFQGDYMCKRRILRVFMYLLGTVVLTPVFYAALYFTYHPAELLNRGVSVVIALYIALSIQQHFIHLVGTQKFESAPPSLGILAGQRKAAKRALKLLKQSL